jgi:hypothetical protein
MENQVARELAQEFTSSALLAAVPAFTSHFLSLIPDQLFKERTRLASTDMTPEEQSSASADYEESLANALHDSVVSHCMELAGKLTRAHFPDIYPAPPAADDFNIARRRSDPDPKAMAKQLAAAFAAHIERDDRKSRKSEKTECVTATGQTLG